MEDRKNLDKRYTWDLTRFYKNEEQIEHDIEKMKLLNTKIVSLRGKLNTSDAIFSYFQICEEMSVVCERLGAYVMLRIALDGKDKKALSLSSRLSILETKMAQETAFVSYELAQNTDEFLSSLIKENRFKDFDLDIKDIIRSKPHTLSEEKEKLLAGIGEFANPEDLYDGLTDVDLKFEDVVLLDGSKTELTGANYSFLISNEEQSVRKQTFENMHNVYMSHNMSLSTNFISKLKKGAFFSKQHNFKSVKQSKFFGDEMPELVLDRLVGAVNSNLKFYQDYLKLRKDNLKLDKYYVYDNYVPVIKQVEIKPTYEEAVDIFKKAVSCLGDKYVEYVDNQVANRYVDVFETKNKNSGAFNADLNICNPYVLLNYKPSFYWLGTLAHEFGHMVNTCLINDSQPLSKRGCSIFTAEIASTVNECLLYEYLLETTKDKNFKLFLLDKFLSEFNATVFRQTMFTEFELFAHGAIEQEKPIIYEDLNEFYGSLQSKYFGKDVELPECAKFEWSRIPHFYRPFYVYSYATGFISATIIANRIKKEGKPFVDKYIKFLSSGESDSGYNILKKLGIDICDSKTFEEGFAVYKSKIEQMKKMLEELC